MRHFHSPLRCVLNKTLNHSTFIETGVAQDIEGFDSLSDQEICVDSELEPSESEDELDSDDSSGYSSSEESNSCESDENPDSQDDESEEVTEDEGFAPDYDSDDVSMETDSDEESSVKSQSSEEDSMDTDFSDDESVTKSSESSDTRYFIASQESLLPKLENLSQDSDKSGKNSIISTISLYSSSSNSESSSDEDSLGIYDFERFRNRALDENFEDLPNLEINNSNYSVQVQPSNSRGRGHPVKRLNDN
jgi:hypothetical protein